ncbi:MAG: MTH938/NDUFAF3 family protein [Pseudolabrys sp.]
MTPGGSADAPHLPQPAPIDAYGDGGFRFGGMSHRGSLLCFSDGIWAWPVRDPSQLNERTLAAVFDRAQALDFFLIGAGRDPWPLPDDLRKQFRDLSLSVDTMPTGAAVRTYNILLAENRRVGAGLIAVA